MRSQKEVARETTTATKQVELEETPDAKSDAEPPPTKSAAIYQALLALGDPDAAASDVRKHVIERWPQLRQLVEAEKHWSTYVTQNRDRAARQLGVPRTGRRGRKPESVLSSTKAAGQRITVAEIIELGRIRSKLKNEGDLVEVVRLVLKFGPEARLRKMLDKYIELLKRHDGDSAKAEQFLLELEGLGLNWDG